MYNLGSLLYLNRKPTRVHESIPIPFKGTTVNKAIPIKSHCFLSSPLCLLVQEKAFKLAPHQKHLESFVEDTDQAHCCRLPLVPAVLRLPKRSGWEPELKPTANVVHLYSDPTQMIWHHGTSAFRWPSRILICPSEEGMSSLFMLKFYTGNVTQEALISLHGTHNPCKAGLHLFFRHIHIHSPSCTWMHDHLPHPTYIWPPQRLQSLISTHWRP